MKDLRDLLLDIPENINNCTLDELVEVGKKIYKFEEEMKKQNSMIYNQSKPLIEELKNNLKMMYKVKLFAK